LQAGQKDRHIERGNPSDQNERGDMGRGGSVKEPHDWRRRHAFDLGFCI
jgi:hypothetical protein